VKWYIRAGVLVVIVLGISTLVHAAASKLCLLGYYTHCPFTPISTVICLVIAGVIYWLGKRREK